MAIKYVLCPGPVMSKSDGQWHHIDARTLARLYGVPMSECVVYDPRRQVESLGLIRLTPRYHGDYTVRPSSASATP